MIYVSCNHCSHPKVGLALIKNAYHGNPLIILLMGYYLMKGLYNTHTHTHTRTHTYTHTHTHTYIATYYNQWWYNSIIVTV